MAATTARLFPSRLEVVVRSTVITTMFTTMTAKPTSTHRRGFDGAYRRSIVRNCRRYTMSTSTVMAISNQTMVTGMSGSS